MGLAGVGLVMGLGSKSRVRVPFPWFGYQNSQVFLGFWGFWLPKYITIDGFGSGSGTISRIWVGFGYQQGRISPPGFWVPEPITRSGLILLGSGIQLHHYLKDAVCYGVEIPGTEGKAGMVAILDPERSVDLELLAKQIRNKLPKYARPLFIRIIKDLPLTGTYKLMKNDLQKQGWFIVLQGVLE